MGPFEVLEQKHSVFLILQAPILLYALWYFIKAFKTMYQGSWWVTILKSGTIYLVYMASMGVMFDVVLVK
jgi:hypothetical protein